MKTLIFGIIVPIILLLVAFSISWIVGLLVVFILIWRARADIYSLIAQRKFATNHSDGYKWFEKALKTKRMRPYFTLFYAYMLLRDGALEKAEKLITTTTYLNRGKLSPDIKLSAELNLALIKWKKGNLQGAIADLEEMYNDGYKSSVMYGTLGYLYLIHGDIVKGYKFNQEAIEYNADDNIITDNWGNSLLLRGDKEKALEVYEELIAKNPTFMEAYYNYGKTLLANGEKEKAIAEMEKTLEMEEKYLSELTHEKIRAEIEKIKAEN